MADWTPHRPHPQGAARHLPGARPAGRPDPEERLRVTLVLRPEPLPLDSRIHDKLGEIESALPRDRPRLTEDELTSVHAPAPAHLERVLAFARDHELDVVATSAVRHDVVLEGTAPALSAAFRVGLQRFEHDEGAYLAHREPVQLPEELHDAVVAVLGLHDVPLRRGRHLAGGGPAGRLFHPADVARLYDFPSDATGAGERIAILAFGGGVDPRDLQAYFGAELARPAPTVHAIGVEGRRNRPFDRHGLAGIVAAMREGSATQERLLEMASGPQGLEEAMATIEATMDVEIAGAIAPGAEIDLYVTEPSAHGFYWGLQAALGLAGHDVALDLPAALSRPPGRPTVVSISWGDSEAVWSPAEMEAMELALGKAAHLHVTVCCASGDLGSWTRPADLEGRPLPANVSYPASSPAALAVGGTYLEASPDGALEGERVWNATFLGQRMASGGGMSGVFPRPAYQERAALPTAPGTGIWIREDRRTTPGFVGRWVPDVAANADAASGFRILVAGEAGVGGGTSAAAPLWAGLLALVAERVGHPPGALHSLLYDGRLDGSLRSIEAGDNDVAGRSEVASFRAGPGWDACTGLGVPIGEALARLLAGEG